MEGKIFVLKIYIVKITITYDDDEDEDEAKNFKSILKYKCYSMNRIKQIKKNKLNVSILRTRQKPQGMLCMQNG